MSTSYEQSAIFEQLVSGSSVSHTSGSATLFAASGSDGVQTLYFFKGDGEQVDIGGGSTLTADGDSGGTVEVNLASDTFDIVGGSGVDTTIAKSGTTVSLTIDVDLGEATEAAIDVSADYGLFLDGGATGNTRKDSWADIATAQAGTVTTTGLAASSGVFKWDLQNWTASTTIADADLIGVDDGANGTLRKMTRANFLGSAAAAFSNGMTATTVSGSGAAQFASVHSDSVNLDGGSIDDVVIGAGTAAAASFTTIGASSTSTLAAVTATTVSGSGAAQFASVHSDSVNLDGGNIDGVTIGDASAAPATFTTLEANSTSTLQGVTATTVSGSGAAQFASVHSDSVNLDGGNIDGVIIGASTAAAGTFAAIVGTTISGTVGSLTSLKVNSTIGTAEDTDLLTLESGQLDVAGVVSGSGNFEIGGTCTVAGRILPDTDGTIDLGSSAKEFNDLYLDGTAHLDAINNAADLVWTMVDNSQDAVSFDASGKSGIMFIDTSNGSEHVGFGGYCQIEGSDGSSNGLILGDDGAGVGLLLYGASANEKVQYSAANHTLVWTDSSSATHITIGGDANGEYAIDVANGSNEKNKMRAAAFVTYSDERLKSDVAPIEGALDLVNSMSAVNFTWKKDGSRDFGFLAQDLKKVVPQAVHGNEEGLFGVDYGRLTSILVSAIQEQNVQIKDLKNKLDK
tara:strand:- start:850 stop:2901 length:2052 start_codon:yes stop_codon:yes gene_type:complete